MLQGVILDFDGVIADTELDKFKAISDALRQHNKVLKKSALKEFIGKRTSLFLREKFRDLPESDVQKIISYRRAKQQDYLNNNNNKKTIPGIKDLLEFLKARKCQVAIATGSEYFFVEEVLKRNNLSSLIDIIVSGSDCTCSKPNPASLESALKKMGLRNDEVVVIEDSVFGIQSAKSAGCKVFALTTYLNKKDLEKADLVFASHFEILKYIKEKDL